MILAAKAASAVTGGLPYRWVLADVLGNLHTSDSTTASSWTSRTSSFGATAIYGVASNGSNLYVAVGDSGKLATSPDGITWTQRTSSFGTSFVAAVAYGEGIWTAVGQAGKIATSTDGITWTQRTSGTANGLTAIGFGAGTWVCGGSSTMRSADDPTGTWTSRTSTLTGIDWNQIFYWPAGSIWVAGTDNGTTGALASSPDGITWTARDAPFTAAAQASAFTGNSSVLIFSNVVNQSPLTLDIGSSTNGTTWTNRTPSTTATSGYAAASDDSGLLVVASGTIQSSSDGVTWTNRGANPQPSGPYAFCHSSGVPSIR